MSTLDAEHIEPASPPAHPSRHYLNAGYTAWSWLLTTDHKRVAILYLLSLTFFFFVGGAAAVVFRLELMTPNADLVESETYNKLFTLHGVMMVFFFLIPSVPAVLGNFLMPMMIGARDLAFPKLNLLSWYLFAIGGLITIWVMLVGGVDTGWTFYTPYSSTYSNTYVMATVASVFISGFSSILTGLNFIVTTHTMRAPGMTWFRLPLFVWSNYAAALIMVLGTPVVAVALLLVALERALGVGIFDPALGGDPVLFQHLFWFYSHPAVYIMVLPAMGVISEIIPCFSRRPLFGYRFVAFASLGIAVFGFLVWGHHMFVAGQSLYAGLVFSVLSYLVAVPSAIKVFNWTATLYKGTIHFDTPMLYAAGFVGLFTLGGLTGLFLAALAVDIHVHDTYFVVAHFHYIMVGGTVMAYLGGIHFWWPKMTGRLYPEGWARISSVLIFVGFNLTFFPQFILGYLGMPRRYHIYPEEFQVLNVMSSAGASILGVGYLFPMLYLIWSLKYGALAPANPWQATGLEWQTSSPPPTPNYLRTPIVVCPPYAYEQGVNQLGEPLSNAGSAHQFDDLEQQHDAVTLGMWIFLATEVLLFGGLLAAYTVYRLMHPQDFVVGSAQTNVLIGTVNTGVLLCSSLTMALAVHAAQVGHRKQLLGYLIVTMILGTAFLGVKSYEYYEKFHHHHVPMLGLPFSYEEFKSADGTLSADPRMYFTLYFLMTGLHAIHMVIGLGLLLWMVILAWRGRVLGAGFIPVEMSGLYWHFIDIVWIYLFPLLYLLDRQ